MTEYHRPLAVVTGASSGIGLELAHQFADHGYDLLITAEDDTLEAVAKGLRQAGANVRTTQADLRTFDGVEQLYGAIAATHRPIDAVALNAGIGQCGPFVETDLIDELEIIAVNMSSTVHLAKRLLPTMVARRRGKILVTSSIASAVPGSFQAVYNASKSFLQSFAEALQNELKDTGVTVTSLMHGPTDADFLGRAGMVDTKVGQHKKDDPALVAQQGYDALMAGKNKIVAGSLKTRMQGVANRVLPDRAKASAHRQMAESTDR
jgi:uncharacterized protein